MSGFIEMLMVNEGHLFYLDSKSKWKRRFARVQVTAEADGKLARDSSDANFLVLYKRNILINRDKASDRVQRVINLRQVVEVILPEEVSHQMAIADENAKRAKVDADKKTESGWKNWGILPSTEFFLFHGKDKDGSAPSCHGEQVYPFLLVTQDSQIRLGSKSEDKTTEWTTPLRHRLDRLQKAKCEQRNRQKTKPINDPGTFEAPKSSSHHRPRPDHALVAAKKQAGHDAAKKSMENVRKQKEQAAVTAPTATLSTTLEDNVPPARGHGMRKVAAATLTFTDSSADMGEKIDLLKEAYAVKNSGQPVSLKPKMKAAFKETEGKEDKEHSEGLTSTLRKSLKSCIPKRLHQRDDKPRDNNKAKDESSDVPKLNATMTFKGMQRRASELREASVRKLKLPRTIIKPIRAAWKFCGASMHFGPALFLAYLLGFMGVHWLAIVLLLGILVAFDYTWRRREWKREHKYMVIQHLNKVARRKYEYESAAWLNQSLATAWRELGSTEASKSLRDTIQQSFDDELAGNKDLRKDIKELKFTYLALGDAPPILTGVTSMRGDVNTHEIEIAAMFVGSLAIDISLKLQAGGGVIPQFPIRINNFSVDAVINARLVFGDHLPFLGAIHIGFVELPDFDFSIEPLGAIDVNSFPWLGKTIKAIIRQVLLDSMVLPQRIAITLDEDINNKYIKMLKLSKASDRRNLQADCETMADREDGLLTNVADVIGVNKVMKVFQQKPPPPVGPKIANIRGVVKAGRNLMAADNNGKSDPFVRVYLGSKKIHTTNVVSNTLNPTWDSTFETSLYSSSPTIVEIVVYDRDRTSADDFLGQCALDFSELKDRKEHVQWLSLTGVPHGEIQVQLMVLHV
eukprot:TRINITY_DN2658_c0_g1_i1.p1 TRINITY_DN2658_c0_g1~~TRINITY_DN2658_c0_g1_i1.p1  ORF type:complete len:857 (+),score=137.23 TRINITY_DN2658_c0_g1_i1:251-2821(+)